MARQEAVFTDLLNRGGGRLDFRRFVESGLRSSPGEERGLFSRTAAGNRAQGGGKGVK